MSTKKVDRKRNRTIRRGIVLTLFVIVIIVGLALEPGKGRTLAIGDQAPDFQLVDLEGNVHRLSDYQGKGVFLNFWGTWGAPCKREMPHMESQYNVVKDQGVEVLAVNVKETDLKVSSFRNAYGLTFPIAIDKTEAVKEAYRIKPLPTTILIDPNGKIVDIVTREMSEEQVKHYMEMIRPEK